MIIEFTQAQPSNLIEGGFCQARIWIDGANVLNTTFGSYNGGAVSLFYDLDNYSLDICNRLPIIFSSSSLNFTNLLWIKGSGMAFANQSGT